MLAASSNNYPCVAGGLPAIASAGTIAGGPLLHRGLEKIKSSFFLPVKMGVFFSEKKKLEIFKYNKKIQKRLNLSISDYKEYSQLYSSIEIELKFNNNKNKFYNNNKKNYINFKKKNEQNYIFNFKNINKNIIKIKINNKIKSLKNLFKNKNNIEKIKIKKYRTNITDMSGMFNGCSSLKEIDLSNFNTDNVTDMRDMFNGCSSLKEINLSNFNTNKVTDMGCMFWGCSLLKELNLSNFNTTNRYGKYV